MVRIAAWEGKELLLVIQSNRRGNSVEEPLASCLY
jgi:hypothetical protein